MESSSQDGCVSLRLSGSVSCCSPSSVALHLISFLSQLNYSSALICPNSVLHTHTHTYMLLKENDTHCIGRLEQLQQFIFCRCKGSFFSLNKLNQKLILNLKPFAVGWVRQTVSYFHTSEWRQCGQSTASFLLIHPPLASDSSSSTLVDSWSEGTVLRLLFPAFSLVPIDTASHHTTDCYSGNTLTRYTVFVATLCGKKCTFWMMKPS